ncbi:fibroblast growth factor receptor 3-like [Paramacrobiotus metropolitanus]|uniref:fibroblast growth factor receptor 3-like n=1 Tax=Paramacrobiotus metropolitanus TaxID=2943436 RepID=UPI0024462F36|nr:fibroblast growth factor receptor 3-like [Paramacrobiotus metropolitanus]
MTKQKLMERGNTTTANYTSGRVDTGKAFNFLYGEIEWRAKVPKGKGVWTALWLSHFECPAATVCSHWPPAVSVIDARGDQTYNIYTSDYYTLKNDQGQPTTQSASNTYSSPMDITEDYHLYKLLWTKEKMVWYFDNQEIFSVSERAQIPTDKMQIVMNVAVGGMFPGPPADTTIFPTRFFIDWVVVRQTPSMIATEGSVKNDNSRTILAAVLGTLLPLAAVIIAVVLCIYWRRRQWRHGDMRKESIITLTDSLSSSAYRIYMLTGDDTANSAMQHYVSLLEIPSADLQISNFVLGNGEYGVVRKGLARGLRGQPRPTVVAVKSVKNDKDVDQIKQLFEEMKVMIKAGRHLNIVNLLGAIIKGDVLLLLEFCTHGSLLKYVKQHRGVYFYNHVDSAGRLLEWSSIEAKKLQENIEKAGPKQTFPEDNFDNTLLATRDLLSFTYQISRGMEYLNSRSIIHRDLAARNVLITDGRIIKIADFGMARQQAEYVVYNQQVPLPVRWMPPESIKGRVFSQYSDVWSFGVLLWEIFTLGETPYADSGIHGYVVDFLKTLSSGYQLSRPPYCPEVIYDVMRKCWDLVPTNRPVFSKLQRNLQDIVGDDSAETYLSLDLPYQQFNSAYQEIFDQVVEDPYSESGEL